MHSLLTEANCKFEEKEQNELWFDSPVPEITLWQWFPAANTHSSSESRNGGVQTKHMRGWRDSQQIRQLFFVPIHEIHLGHPGHVKATFLGWADAFWAGTSNAHLWSTDRALPAAPQGGRWRSLGMSLVKQPWTADILTQVIWIPV